LFRIKFEFRFNIISQYVGKANVVAVRNFQTKVTMNRRYMKKIMQGI